MKIFTKLRHTRTMSVLNMYMYTHVEHASLQHNIAVGCRVKVLLEGTQPSHSTVSSTLGSIWDLLIVVKEMLPVVLACALCGATWVCHSTHCHCNNRAVVACLRPWTVTACTVLMKPPNISICSHHAPIWLMMRGAKVVLPGSFTQDLAWSMGTGALVTLLVLNMLT